MKDKFIVLSLTVLLLLVVAVPTVTAEWWNPFTWFGEDYEVVKGEGWYTDYSSDHDYFIYFSDKNKKKTEVCLLSRTANKLNDLDQHKNLYDDNKVLVEKLNRKKKNIDGEDYYGYCRNIDSEEFKSYKFGENSTVIEYTTETVKLKDSDNNTVLEAYLIGDFEYKDGKPHKNTHIGYQEIYTIKLIGYTEIENVVNDIKLVNLRSGLTENKEFDLKLRYTELVPKYTYDINTSDCWELDLVNTTTCSLYVNHTYYVSEYKYMELDQFNNNFNIANGQEVYLSIFMDLKQGEYIDYVPEIAGVPFEFWASIYADFKDGLVLAMPFENSTNNTHAIDRIGGNDGAITGATRNTTECAVGDCFFFDGTNDKIQIPFNQSIEPTNTNEDDYTWAGWIYAIDTGNTMQLYRELFNSDRDGDQHSVTTNCSLNLYAEMDNIYSVDVVSGGSDFDCGAWHHIVFVVDDTNNNASVYLNGEYFTSKSGSAAGGGDRDNDHYMGENPAGSLDYTGNLDEIYVWNRDLTPSEAVQIHELEFLEEGGDSTSPVVNLGTPTNGTIYNTNSKSEDFTCWAYDDIKLDNLTFYLYNTSTDSIITTDTETSPVNNTNETFTYTITSGTNYTWNCYGCDNSSNCDFATNNYTLIVNPIPDNAPVITEGSGNPTGQYTTLPQTFTFNASNVYDDINLDNVSLYINGAINQTNTSGINNTGYLFTQTFSTDGTYTYYLSAVDNSSQEATTTQANFTIDSIVPSITFISPVTIYGILNNGTSVDLNVTVSDTNLDSCWYNYNGLNNTATCNANTTISYVSGQDSLTYYSNDTLGNLGIETQTWTVQLTEYEDSFVNETVEGTTNLFWVKIGTNESVRSATLYYNGTGTLGSLNQISGDIYNATVSLISQGVDAVTNYSFYWEIELISGTEINLSTNYQVVNPVVVGNCSTYSNTLINFTVKDEEGFNVLGNTSMQMTLNAYDTAKALEVIAFSVNTTSNPYGICLNETLGTSTLLMDVVVQYDSVNYFKEFYNIRNYTLTESTRGQNISLYPINESKAQEFKITYKDADFSIVKGALVQISRKYLSLDEYIVTEIPKTGDDGTAIAHLVVNDVIYKLVFIDYDGSILAVFDDVTAKCQNPTFEDCEINVNSFSSGIDVTDYNTTGGVSANLDFDPDTRTVSATFVSISGVNADMRLNVTIFDLIGDTSVCSDSTVATSGTLTCVVPQSFGNITVYATVEADDVVIRKGVLSLNQEPKDLYGFSIVFLGMFIFLTVIGMSVSDSPMTVTIFSLLGFVLLIGLNIIVTPSWFGTSASLVAWLLMTSIIVFIKSGSRR